MNGSKFSSADDQALFPLELDNEMCLLPARDSSPSGGVLTRDGIHPGSSLFPGETSNQLVFQWWF